MTDNTDSEELLRQSNCGPLMIPAQVTDQVDRIFVGKVFMRMLDAILGCTN